MTGEECLMKGLCSCCEEPIGKVWTQQEITAAKEDLGMSDDEDFGDWCDACFKSNTGMDKADIIAKEG